MKNLIVIALLMGLTNSSLFAQIIIPDNIVGTWQVKQLYAPTELPKEQEYMLEVLRDQFLKSQIIFEKEGGFTFEIGIPDVKIENAHWKFSRGSNSYIVQSWEDKDGDSRILMEIFAMMENGKPMFVLEETFFKLEMKKSN